MATNQTIVKVKVDAREARKFITDVRREVSKRNAAAMRALKLIDTFAWSAVRCDHPKATKELQRRVDACRKALKHLASMSAVPDHQNAGVPTAPG